MSGPSYASLYGRLIGRLEERERIALAEYRRAKWDWMRAPSYQSGFRDRRLDAALIARARWSALRALMAEPEEVAA